MDYEEKNTTYNEVSDYVEPPMSIGQWVLTIILTSIPCVNVVAWIVWLVGNGNRSRKNYCIASIIVWAACVVLSMIFGASLGAALGAMYN